MVEYQSCYGYNPLLHRVVQMIVFDLYGVLFDMEYFVTLSIVFYATSIITNLQFASIFSSIYNPGYIKIHLISRTVCSYK